jgi:hypothetical protein
MHNIDVKGRQSGALTFYMCWFTDHVYDQK